MSNTSQIHADENSTVAPVRNSTAISVDPEFVDSKGLEARFGIKRSLAYQLDKAALIRSVCLRRKGQTRGKRLFNVASVRAYLHCEMGAQD